MLNLTKERFTALTAYRQAAAEFFASCTTDDELQEAERLLCLETCACAAQAPLAARSPLAAQAPLAAQSHDVDSLDSQATDDGAVYCP